MESEIIDISSLDFGSKPIKSATFGDGIELLMNEKVRSGSGSSSPKGLDIDDLNNLESELNELSQEAFTFQPKSDLFSSSTNPFGTNSFGEKKSVHFDTDAKDSVSGPSVSGSSVPMNPPTPSIGQSTAETTADAKTWDGFGKFNNVPINPDKAGPLNQSTPMSKEELLREKFKYLRKLEALEKKGVELSKKYNMESSLQEMQGEYETIMEEKAKQNSVKFQGNMMMAVINGIEFLNGRFDPFDIKLDGWGEQLNENINDYDDIFGELYEKYKSKASMAPELKLLFQLGGSAMMVHMTNTMFKSAMPGMDDILRQNPDLMRQFQTAAVSSLGATNPGFGGFMSGIMNPEPSVGRGPGPPPPMATQGFGAPPPPSVSRGGNNSASLDRNLNMTRPNFTDDGINVKETFSSLREQQQRQEQVQRSGLRPPPGRAEMKGPSDITDILSGLKTKTINIQEAADADNVSTISLNDLKNDGTMPKKSRRKPTKSDRNTISLDI
jgi:hypothetical protein